MTEQEADSPPRRPPVARAASDPDRQYPAQPGDHLAHFEILSLIGEGGMGLVYRARDLALQRGVALKCPWPRLAADPVSRRRFLREARSAASLAHPNILPVFEILEWRDLPWVSMELVEGCNLTSLLVDGKALAVDRIVFLADGIAGALEAAHAHHLLHRDVTPNNVLIRRDGWPLLTDFGLAHGLVGESQICAATTVDSSLTRPGQILGTVPYMSPEQALGEPLDARSDLFSLGAVLYEMCTGRRAFGPGSAAQVYDAILHGEPVAIRTLNPQIPPALEAIVRRALAKRPRDRYPSATALRADLAELRRSIDSGSAGRAPTRGRAAPAPLAVVVLVVLVAAMAGWRWLAGREPNRGLPVGTPLQLTTQRGWERDPAISPDGELVAYAADTSGDPDLWLVESRGGTPLQLTADPGVDDSPAWFPDGKTLAFVSDRTGAPSIWTVPKLGGPPVLLIPDAVDPAISPDGQRIAFARPDSAGGFRIAMAPLDDLGQVQELTANAIASGQGDHRHPAWSPDSRTLCYADARNLWLVVPGAGPPRPLTSQHAADRDPVWSADGRGVYFFSYRGGTLALWRVSAQGGAPARLTFGTGPEVEPGVSRDGSRLVYSTFVNDYHIELVDLARQERADLPGLLDETAPALAPDGSALVYTSSGRGSIDHLWLQPLAGLRPKGSARPLTQLPGTVNTPSYSPDGRWIAFKREQNGRREIAIVPSAGGAIERFSDGAGDDLHPAWSPDSAHLVFVSLRGGEQHLWRAAVRDGKRAGPDRAVTTGFGTDELPAWSWDGKWIAFVRCAAENCSLQVVAAAGNEPPRKLAQSAQIGRVRWDRTTGLVWYAAVDEGERVRLFRIDPAGGPPMEQPNVLPGETAPPGEFDLALDGRLFAVTRREMRGDIWLLDAAQGTF